MAIQNRNISKGGQRVAWLLFAICAFLAFGTLGCQRQLAVAAEEEQSQPQNVDLEDEVILAPLAITKNYFVSCKDAAGSLVVRDRGVASFSSALALCKAEYQSNVITISTASDSHYSIPASLALTIQPQGSITRIKGKASTYEMWGDTAIYPVLDNRGDLLLKGKINVSTGGAGSGSGAQTSVDAAVYNYAGATLTLEKLTATGGCYGVVNCGSLVFGSDSSSADFYGTKAGLLNISGSTEITGGTIRGDTELAIDVRGGTVTITGGCITCSGSSLISCASGATVYIPGTSTAQFSHDVSGYCQAGYKTAFDSDLGYYVVVEDVPVVSLLTVSSTAGGFASGQGNYQEGVQVTVVAEAQKGFCFSGWFVNATPEDAEHPTPSGECLSDSSTYSFVMPNKRLNLMAVFEAQPLAQANIVVCGESFTVAIGDTSGQPESCSQRFEAAIPVGTLVAIEYTGTDDFSYWANESQKIMGRASRYSFYVTSTTTLTAVSACSQVTSCRVSYKSAYDRVIKSAICAKGSTLDPPSNPVKLGHEFCGWSIDGEEKRYSSSEIAEAIRAHLLAAQNLEDVEITPCFERIQGAYKLTIQSYVDESWNETQVLNFNQQGLLRLTAQDKEGYYFSCWKQGNQVISTAQTCLLFLRQDTSLEAFYVSQQAEAQEQQALLLVGDFFMTEKDGAHQVTHISIHQVPESYTTVAYGVLLTISSEAATEENMCVTRGGEEGSGVQVRIQNQRNSQDSYAYTASFKQGSTTTLYLRAFLVYRDEAGEQQELYTPIVSCSYNGIVK